MGALDMFPAFPTHNSVNALFRHSVSLAQHGSGHGAAGKQRADFHHSGGREFCGIDPFTPTEPFRVQATRMPVTTNKTLWMCTRGVLIAKQAVLGVFTEKLVIAFHGSSFCYHISHVVVTRPAKKIIRIATWWIVAVMQNIFGPLAGGYKERNAVGLEAPLVISRKTTIAASQTRSTPFPARTMWSLAWRFINILPKSGNSFDGQVRRVYSRFSHFISYQVNLVRAAGVFMHLGGLLHYNTPNGPHGISIRLR